MPFTQWTSWMVVRGFSNQQLAAPEVGRSSELIVEIAPPESLSRRVLAARIPEVLRILTLPEPFYGQNRRIEGPPGLGHSEAQSCLPGSTRTGLG
jgi:hypothetical protein